MSLTKQDIDALVDGMHRINKGTSMDSVHCTMEGHLVATEAFRRTLYLAAGLTAEGARKPERVRCWMVTWDGDASGMAYYPYNPPDNELSLAARVTPGWFVPDGAE